MTLAPRPPSDLDLDRRRFGALAVLGTGALATSSCTSSRSDDAAPSVVDEDPDLALVAEVSAVLAERVRLLEETVARHRGLARRLAPLTGAHRAHLAVLADAAPPEPTPAPPATTQPSPSTPPPVPGRRRTALVDVLTAESAASDELLRLAFRARSGPLARLVAGMAASTSMYVAHLSGSFPDGVSTP